MRQLCPSAPIKQAGRPFYGQPARSRYWLKGASLQPLYRYCFNPKFPVSHFTVLITIACQLGIIDLFQIIAKTRKISSLLKRQILLLMKPVWKNAPACYGKGRQPARVRIQGQSGFLLTGTAAAIPIPRRRLFRKGCRAGQLPS